MRHKFFALLVILSFSLQFTISAQNDTIWYDKEWNETSKLYAEFFRPKPKKENGKYIVQDYYINGKLQMVGPSIRQDTTLFDGEVTYYNKSGTTERTLNYKNGIPHGRATQYFEDGKPRLTSTFENGKLIGDIFIFDSSNKTLTFKIENDSKIINDILRITPIKTESYVKIDYSDIEPEPFEMIIYYTDDYGESKINRIIVNPILNYYISKLPKGSKHFYDIYSKLDALIKLNMSFEKFYGKLFYYIENYRDNSNN